MLSDALDESKGASETIEPAQTCTSFADRAVFGGFPPLGEYHSGVAPYRAADIQRKRTEKLF